VIGPGAALVGVVLRDDIERILDGAADEPVPSLYLPRSSS
jgi:hypothetical protein